MFPACSFTHSFIHPVYSRNRYQDSKYNRQKENKDQLQPSKDLGARGREAHGTLPFSVMRTVREVSTGKLKGNHERTGKESEWILTCRIGDATTTITRKRGLAGQPRERRQHM